MSTINVVKHDGSKEPLDISKGSASLEWAIGDLPGVFLSEIEIQSNLHFFDGIETSYITDIYIKTCDDLADLRSPNYDIVARNLKLQKLYKRVFQSIEPQSLSDFMSNRVAAGHYSHNILPRVDYVDYTELEKVIDHNRDFTFTSSGLDALIKGYGVCQYETPQFMFMAIAIDTFRDYHIDPMGHIIRLYNALSTFDVTLPSPEMRALRTDSTDYASCITFRMGDNIDSWDAAASALLLHTVASAGVGIDIADIASIGDKVKNGKISHGGKVPILKDIDADIARASQNGRRGSATGYLNFFDPEIETIFALKSPRMPVEDRINDLSYGIKLNQLIYDRAKAGLPISLFSVRKAPKMLELFYGKDIKAFTEYYEQCEAEGLYSAQIDAKDFLVRLVAVESTETSAYYILNIDEVNSNTPHLEPITNFNICMEYGTATKPVQTYNPDSPDIGVCVLGNVNQGTVGIDRLPEITDLLVRAQSHIMTRQKHPTSQANAYVAKFRDIGIGLSNHAFWLADNNFRYGQPEALETHNEWMEHFSFGLYQASANLAAELGAAPGFVNHDKLLPISRYNKNVDELCTSVTYCNWNALKAQIAETGLYNCGLSMIPPAETSAGPSNQTTSLEPIRNLLTIKDKSGVNYKQFAPHCIRLADKYDFAYDQDINIRFIKNVAVSQKWLDKGISANTFYNPEWNNGKILAKSIVRDLYVAKYYGVKGRYYQNTKLPDEVEITTDACGSGGCSV